MSAPSPGIRSLHDYLCRSHPSRTPCDRARTDHTGAVLAAGAGAARCRCPSPRAAPARWWRRRHSVCRCAWRLPRRSCCAPAFRQARCCGRFHHACFPIFTTMFLLSRQADLNCARATLYGDAVQDRAARTIRAFSSNSRDTKRKLAEHCRPDAEITLYRPPVRNVFKLESAERAEREPERSPLRLVALGTVEPRKNFIAAARISSRALRQHGFPGATLDIVGRKGWGDDWKTLERMSWRDLARLPVDRERGAQFSMRPIFSSAPRTKKASALPLLEAQYAGLPIVAPECARLPRSAGHIRHLHRSVGPRHRSVADRRGYRGFAVAQAVCCRSDREPRALERAGSERPRHRHRPDRRARRRAAGRPSFGGEAQRRALGPRRRRPCRIGATLGPFNRGYCFLQDIDTSTRHLDGLRIVAASAVVDPALFGLHQGTSANWSLHGGRTPGTSICSSTCSSSSPALSSPASISAKVGSPAAVGRFLWRRLARIYPLHLATLAFYIADRTGASCRHRQDRQPGALSVLRPAGAVPAAARHRWRAADLQFSELVAVG